jgi:hypothetical protein
LDLVKAVVKQKFYKSREYTIIWILWNETLCTVSTQLIGHLKSAEYLTNTVNANFPVLFVVFVYFYYKTVGQKTIWRLLCILWSMYTFHCKVWYHDTWRNLGRTAGTARRYFNPTVNNVKGRLHLQCSWSEVFWWQSCELQTWHDPLRPSRYIILSD